MKKYKATLAAVLAASMLSTAIVTPVLAGDDTLENNVYAIGYCIDRSVQYLTKTEIDAVEDKVDHIKKVVDEIIEDDDFEKDDDFDKDDDDDFDEDHDDDTPSPFGSRNNADGLIMELGLDGDYVKFEGLKIWVPSEMEEYPIEQEESSNWEKVLSYRENELFFEAFVNPEVTLDEFEELAKAEYRVFSGYEINGMNMFSYGTGEGDYVSFVVENDGKVIELSFGPVYSDFVDEIMAMMCSVGKE